MENILAVIVAKKVVWPNSRDSFDTDNPDQIEILKKAAEGGRRVIFTPEEMDLTQKLTYTGTLALVTQMLSPFEEVANILYAAEQQVVFKVIEKSADGVYLAEEVNEFAMGTVDEIKVLALVSRLKSLYEEYAIAAEVSPQIPGDGLEANINAIAAMINCRQKSIYLENDLEKKLLLLCADLKTQTEITKMESEIEERVKDAAEQNQKEFYIREQISALNDELGEDEDADFYLEKVAALSISDDLKKKLGRDVKRMKNMSMGSPELAIIKNYLDIVIELPWNTYTEDSEDLKQAAAILEQDHYGLKKVKQRLLEALAVRLLTKDGRSPIICLYGPAGVGKTSIAKSIASAMNKKYVRVSFGGVRDEAEIRGHRKTYIGSMPGRIITGISTAGSMNPVFLMDEIDKMSADYKGDPASALLEVLDPEQNINFRDHYLEMPFDLSQVLFITTANTLDTISRPLLDRMEIIEMSGYTYDEKLQIAKRHLLPKAMHENGIKKDWVKLSDSAIENIIYQYTKESGVRGLSKQLAQVMRKVAMEFVKNPNHKTMHVTEKNLIRFLGKPKFVDASRDKQDAVGMANGLAWTEVGGETLPVEVASIVGKGDIILTGSLGDVMKESARIGLSYLRQSGLANGLADDYFKTHDIHIHVPEGATPKDGPSAGITMATAMLSMLNNVPVRWDTAMTGEITLRGNVLPIGGLKEKTLAALRSGAKRVIVPEENRKDYDELPDPVKKGLEFVFVKKADEVFKNALRSTND